MASPVDKTPEETKLTCAKHRREANCAFCPDYAGFYPEVFTISVCKFLRPRKWGRK